MSHDECLPRRLAAVCGRDCALCDAVQDGLCCGCGCQLGQTRWGQCAIFQCCTGERGLEHCGLCPDFPCQVFMGQAHPLEVARRYRALCRCTEIDTIA